MFWCLFKLRYDINILDFARKIEKLKKKGETLDQEALRNLGIAERVLVLPSALINKVSHCIDPWALERLLEENIY